MQDGIHIEIGFFNYFGIETRKYKFTMNIKDLEPPPMYEDSYALKGNLFPSMIEEFEIEDEDEGIPWVKYSDVVRRKMYVSKKYDYMDKELMIAIMNGKYIDINN